MILKSNLANFIIQIQNGLWSSRDNTTSTRLAQELLMNVQRGGGSEGLQEMSLPVRSVSGLTSNWQYSAERITDTDPVTTTQEVAVELSEFYSCWTFEVNWKGEKALWWVPHERPENFKMHWFWKIIIFSYFMQQQRTISQLDCDMWWKVDFIQLTMTSSMVGPRGRIQSTSQGQTCTSKEGTVTVWVLSLPVLIPLTVNPGETVKSEKNAQQMG